MFSFVVWNTERCHFFGRKRNDIIFFSFKERTTQMELFHRLARRIHFVQEIGKRGKRGRTILLDHFTWNININMSMIYI